MNNLKRFIPLLLLSGAALTAACDDGELELDQRTATVGFETSRIEIEQSTEEQIPLVIRASKGSMLKAYTVYVEVEDPEAWIGDVCTVANPVYKTADPENGDYTTVYTANMGEGTLKTGLLLTAGVHSSEDRDRELTFRIVEDPLGGAYPNGNPYYRVGSQRSIRVLLKKTEP
ncbi:hypothetical protein [Alistipes sp.]|uniref:hypothetical protein n=1 Tax=Alistipes sp. TaxID=1872444 RepID=UPI003AF1D04B